MNLEVSSPALETHWFGIHTKVFNLCTLIIYYSHVLPDDPFDHVGSILVNLSKSVAGRKFLLDPKRALLKQILRQFDSTSLLRKKGVCVENIFVEFDSLVRNILLCLFQRDKVTQECSFPYKDPTKQ